MVAKPEARDPAMLVYGADFYADEAVQLMSLEQEGAYWRALMHAHREGSIPASLDAICAIVAKVPARRFPAVWAGIACKWVPHPTLPDRLVNPRQEREREKRAESKQRMRDGAARTNATRWGSPPDNGASRHPTATRSNGGRHPVASQVKSSERVSEGESAREDSAAESPPPAAGDSRRKATVADLEARRGPPGLDPPSPAEVAAMLRALERHRVYPQSLPHRNALARALAAEREHPDNLEAYVAELGGKDAAQRGARLCSLLTDPERLRDTNARVCREAHEGKP